MKIVDIRETTVTVPLETPLRHANSCHWGRFVRTIIEVETDEGIIGLGEMGGGGESAENAFRAMKAYLVGHNPANLKDMRPKISNPAASLYNNRTQILAGVQLATMLHLGAVIPNLTFAADAHYHHLTDDIIEGGKFEYVGGKIKVPDAPGLGVKLNRDKLNEYAELYKELGGYNYDKDPLRPDWSPIVPNTRWADPNDDRTPNV